MASRCRRGGGDSGAVAVLVVLVVLVVALPLAGLGVYSFVAGGTAAELRRAADAGALAGAAAIPLGDVAFAKAYAAGASPGELAGAVAAVPGLAVDPLQVACDRAVAAARVDDALSRAYVAPFGQDKDFPGCRLTMAAYRPDTSALPALMSCASFLANPVLSEIPTAVTPPAPPPPLGPLPTVSVPALDPLAEVGRLGGVVPALVHPGVTLTLQWEQQGPLDSLLGRTGTRTQTVVSAAERRLKNLVVLPMIATPLGSYDVSADLARTTDAAFDLLGRLATGTVDQTVTASLGGVTVTPTATLNTVGLPPACQGVFSALRDDYADGVRPASSSRSQDDIVRGALAGEEPLTVVLLGPGPSFYDTLTVCVQRPAPSFSSDARLQVDLSTVPPTVTVVGGPAVSPGLATVQATLAACPATPGGFRASLVRP